MYEAFYQLDTEPFRLCPDASFCFKHRSYAKARAYLQYAWYRAEGLAMVTGDPGTGKTTLANDLLADLHTEDVVVGRLVTTQVDADDLLRMVALAFGVGVDGAPKARVSECVKDFLAEQQRQGRRVLLVVDEAQDLARSALEELRLLTDLESEGHYLLQVFLFGHPVLQDILRQPDLAPLQQRFIVACHLQPLDREGTESYVRHRMAEAGWLGDPQIEDEVFPLIHQASRGVPRRINLVCSRLLLHGYAEQQHTLGGEDVRQVVQDLRSEMLLSAEIEGQDDTLVTAGDQPELVSALRPEPPSVSANVFSPTGKPEAPGKGQEESGQANRTDREPRHQFQKASVPALYAAPMLPEPVQRISTAGPTGLPSVRAAVQGLYRQLTELLSFSGVGGPRDQRRRGYAGGYVLISLVAGLALGVTYLAVPRVVELAGSEVGAGAGSDARRLTQDRTILPRPQATALHKSAQPLPSATTIEASPVAPVMTGTQAASPEAEPRKPEPLPENTIARASKTSQSTDRQLHPDRNRGERAEKKPARQQAEQGRQVKQARQAKRVARRSTANKQLVADIQSRLLRAGHDPGPIDGISGSRTRSAITAYQRERGLAPNAGATTELLMHLIQHRRN